MADDARSYWARATDTFRAPGDYYERTAEALRRRLVPRLAPGDRLLDIGCGEGTFTALLAPHVDRVEAFDLSPELIAQAQARALPNVTFAVGDALATGADRFDAVILMGVLVCLVDDADFARALDGAAGQVRAGGLLVLRETFSGWGRQVDRSENYAVCYRPRKAYRLPDFDVVAEDRLATWSRWRRRSNHLLVLRRRPPP